MKLTLRQRKTSKGYFWRKAGEVKDASRRAEPGIKGVVIKTQLFEKQAKRTKREERTKILEFQKEAAESKKRLKDARDEKLVSLLKDEISNGIRDLSSGKTLIKKSTRLTLKRLNSFDLERFAQDQPWVESKKVWAKIEILWRSFQRRVGSDRDSPRKEYI